MGVGRGEERDLAVLKNKTVKDEMEPIKCGGSLSIDRHTHTQKHTHTKTHTHLVVQLSEKARCLIGK